MSGEKILIIEDERNLRTILRLQLERAGYNVVAAEDGEAGIRAVVREMPDLVLLDIMMPKMDGYEVCREIKSNFTTANIPVVMLTAKSEMDDKIRGLGGGANDYLTKPYEQKELLVRVRNILDWSKTQRGANPLTGLPGNVSIEQEVQRRFASGAPFAFLYLDIDNFKAFNDHYGYQKGDAAIKLTASIISKAVGDSSSDGDFVGHVGGDDFVIITRVETATEISDRIIEVFDTRAAELYSKPDRSRGYIEVENRQHKLQRFPLMSLTIAAVTNQGRKLDHLAQICDIVAELKHYGKSQAKDGSIVVWERRCA